MQHVMNILASTWQIMLDASPFIILGFLFAALIRAFISTETIIKYMGGRDIKSVFLASLFGVPLPLCSCGVVPTAIGLRKQGASKPATVSFLISTPESSIDSIAITYALIDPLMTVFRPVAAFITGIVAGIAEIIIGKREETSAAAGAECPHCHDHDSPPLPATTTLAGRQKGGVKPRWGNAPLRGEGGSGHTHSITERVSGGLRFAFIELLTDVSRWFLAGMFIAGVITYAMPTSFVENYLGEGWLSMLIMLAVGLPLYVCATASTPIAAALILKGMSPGAALVFLLVGPATNAASFSVIASTLGKRSAVIYIVSIAVCAVILGMSLNWLYQVLGVNIHAVAGHAHEMVPVWLKWTAAVPLMAAMLIGAVRKR